MFKKNQKAYDKLSEHIGLIPLVMISPEDLTARCFLHEIDHLDGHMYTEFAEKMLTQEELDELLKQEQEAEEGEETEA